jgi:anti-sigma factor RsiW
MDMTNEHGTDPRILEQLSAFADGELPKAEAELLVARLCRDPALAAVWARWHAASEVMRGGLPPRYPRELAARVQAALAAEDGHRASLGWRKPLLGTALAAGVAALAILAVRMQNEPAPGVIVPMTAGSGGAAAGQAQLVDYDPALAVKLNSYVARHNAVSGHRLPAVAPHVQVAAQDPQAVDPAATPSTGADATSAKPPQL